MRFTYRPIGLLFLFVIVNGYANASLCTTAAMEQITTDSTLTSLQKQHRLNDLCVGQRLSVKGAVTDVSRSSISIFPLRGTLETSYRHGHAFRLAQNHQCGDLLTIQKGDMLSLEGTVIRVFGNIQSLNLSDSLCLENR